MSNATKQNLVVILGMHRSGTSALAGALHRGGLSFGDNLMPPSYDNRKGYFENVNLVDLHDQILLEQGLRWYAVTDKSKLEKLESQAKTYSTQINQLISQEYTDLPTVGIKDPRLSLLLRAYTDDYHVTPVLITRSPHDVIESLYHREYYDRRMGGILYTQYLLMAEQNTRELNPLIVNYDQLLHEPNKQLIRIQEHLSGIAAIDVDDAIQFIDQHLRTHRATSSSTPSVELALAEKVYNAINNHSSVDIMKELWSEYQELVDQLPQKRQYFDPVKSRLLIKTSDDGWTKQDLNGRHQITENSDCRVDVSLEVRDVQILKILWPKTAKAIELKSLSIQPECHYLLKTNSLFRKGRTYHFEDENPFLDIIFTKKSTLSTISWEYHIIEKTTESLVKKHTDSHPVIQLFRTILFHPASIIKSINLYHWKVLRRAILHEPPSLIIKNFIRLIRQGQYSETYQPPLTKVSDEHKSTTKALNVLVVAPNIPDSTQSAGERRLVEILLLIRKNNNVILFAEKHIASSISRNKLIVSGVDIYHSIPQLTRDHPSFDTVIFCWHQMYSEYVNRLNQYSTAKTIVDSVDIHWIRESRSVGIVEGMTPDIVNKNKAREVDAYRRSDEVWVVSHADAMHISDEIPDINFVIVGLTLSKTELPPWSVRDSNLLFLGSYRHAPNVHAAQRLIWNIFPRIAKVIPDAKLWIAGPHFPKELLSVDHRGIDILGYLSDDQLEQYYNKATAVICPLNFGAGVKGKITEAIENGVPIITTSIGNEGINLVHREDALIADSDEELAQLTIELLQGKYDLQKMRKSAIETLYDSFEIEKMEERINRSLARSVCICIVTYNRLDLLKNCIDSILQCTFYPNYTIDIFSNGCTDGTKEYLSDLSTSNQHINFVCADQNLGFIIPNNQLIDRNIDADIVLLNNDVEVTPYWLCRLYQGAYRMDHIGIAGSKILNFDGSLQEYGGAIYHDGQGINFGSGHDPYNTDYQSIKAVPYTSGCVFYIKRTTIDIIGTLDEELHPCYYEDSDYCYRSWLHGLWTVVIPNSIIYHHQGATAGTDETKGFKKYQNTNKEAFLVKHQNNFSRISKLVIKANKNLRKLNK